MDRGRAQHIGPHFPTYLTARSKTTPDIAITNKKVFHNHYLQPGSATVSDHIPVILKITIAPIQIPIRERYNFPKADWEEYRRELEEVPIIQLHNKKTEEMIMIMIA